MKLIMEGWRDWLNRDKEEEEPKPPPEPSIKYGNVYVDRRFSAGIDKHGNRRGGRLYTFKTTATFSPGNKHINLWGVLADNTGYLLSGMRKGQEKSYPRLVPGSGGIIVDLEKDIKIPNVDDQNALDGDTAIFLHRGSIAISTKVPTPAPRKGENPYDIDQEFQHWFLKGSLSLESYDDFKAAYEQAKDIIVNGAGRLSMAAPTPGEGELSLSNDNDNGALSVVKESKLIMEGWKRFLTESEIDAGSQQFKLAKPTILRLTTELDGATRDIVIVEHPDNTVKAYFKSSGISGGGYAGAWIPFEGWATNERVPKGQTFTDGTERQMDEVTWVDRPYGHYVLMAKTYWNKSSAKPPENSIHAAASEWLQDLENLSDDQKPKLKEIISKNGVENNMALFGKINQELHRMGAIDRSAAVLNVKSSGRRIQFGLDEES